MFRSCSLSGTACLDTSDSGPVLLNSWSLTAYAHALPRDPSLMLCLESSVIILSASHQLSFSWGRYHMTQLHDSPIGGQDLPHGCLITLCHSKLYILVCSSRVCFSAYAVLLFPCRSASHMQNRHFHYGSHTLELVTRGKMRMRCKIVMWCHGFDKVQMRCFVLWQAMSMMGASSSQHHTCPLTGMASSSSPKTAAWKRETSRIFCSELLQLHTPEAYHLVHDIWMMPWCWTLHLISTLALLPR